MGAVPPGGNVWKTILIGVVTTVIAYIIVNLIFSNKGKKEVFKRKKEAAVNTWKIVLLGNELFLNDYYSAFCEKDDSAIVKKLNKAIEKRISEYDLLKIKPDTDELLASYLNSYIERGNELRGIIQEFFEERKTIDNNSDLSEYERRIRRDQLNGSYQPKLAALSSLDSNRISVLHQALIDRYGNHFKPLEKRIASESTIIGNWQVGTTNHFFSFNEDKTVYINKNGLTYLGTWSINDNMITFRSDANTLTNYYIQFYGPDYIWFSEDHQVIRLLCRR